VRAAPDGYTLGLFGAPSAINATLYDKLISISSRYCTGRNPSYAFPISWW